MQGLSQQAQLGSTHSGATHRLLRSPIPSQRQRALVTHASGSTFGHSFRVTTFGESHGKGVGCVIDGVPPRLPITKEEIQVWHRAWSVPSRALIATPTD